MSEFQLSNGIISRSSSNTWDEAKLEWSLFEVYEDEEFDTCLCGHYPIKEICILKNKKNHNTAKVRGNSGKRKYLDEAEYARFLSETAKLERGAVRTLCMTLAYTGHEAQWNGKLL